MVSYEDDNSSIVADSAAAVYLLSGNASNIHPFPGLKFYNRNCSGPSGEKGWHIEKNRGNFNTVEQLMVIYHLQRTISCRTPLLNWFTRSSAILDRN